MTSLRRHLWLVVMLACMAVMFGLGFVWAVMLLPDERLHAYAAQSPAPSPTPWPVWINTAAHTYHRHGSRWYARTLQGRFASEEEAISEGDRFSGEGR